MPDYDIAEHLGEKAPREDEAELIGRIVASQEMMRPKKPEDAGDRAQHPKGFGLAKAKFRVLALASGDADLRQGLFAREGEVFDAVIRFSNGGKPADNDPGGDAHGMAIKVLGVGGDRYEADAGNPGSMDFVMIDNEVFFEGDLEDYQNFHDFLEEVLNFVRNRGSIGKGLLKLVFLKAKEKAIMLVPGIAGLDPGALAKSVNDQMPFSPLTTKYWSTTPYLLGPDRAVKYRADPQAEKPGYEDAEPATFAALDRNYLTRRLWEALEREGGWTFTLNAEVQHSPDDHPVEDPAKPWSAGKFRSVPLAEIELLAPGPGDIVNNPAAPDAKRRDRASGFNPWNVSPDHRPLGAINRARRRAYRQL